MKSKKMKLYRNNSAVKYMFINYRVRMRSER